MTPVLKQKAAWSFFLCIYVCLNHVWARWSIAQNKMPRVFGPTATYCASSNWNKTYHITYPLLLVHIALLFFVSSGKTIQVSNSIGIRSRNYTIIPYQSPLSWLVSPCLTPFLMGPKVRIRSNLRNPSISGPWGPGSSGLAPLAKSLVHLAKVEQNSFWWVQCHVNYINYVLNMFGKKELNTNKYTKKHHDSW